MNLYVALLETQQEGIQYLWVDALCINQADEYEKAAQIKQMGQIYSMAEKVIAWLGLEPGTHVTAGQWV